MNHSELVQIAKKWLTKTKRCGFVLTELVCANASGEIPDAIGFTSMISILVECKTSRSDFLADKKKCFRMLPDLGMGELRYHLAPEGVIYPEDLPENWGLVIVKENGKLRKITKAKPFPRADCLRAERAILYSALRRVNLRGDLEKIYENPYTRSKS